MVSAMKPLVGLLALFLVTCRAGGPYSHLPDSPETEIPIRRVVLYQNGIGYFEREGAVDGEVLTLRIRPSQVNDLLKSLTVIDTKAGRAVSISLPLEKSGDRVLSELPEPVRDARGLLDVLSVFRGARVKIYGQRGSASGRVVGVENMETREDDVVVPDWRVTLRTERGELVVLPVRQIQSVEILDHALAVGLEESLDVSLAEGDWKPVSLSIRLAGKGEHQLQASYVVEMPRWKPAYRLVLGEKAPLLQGWAVVDNVSGEDWRNVKLSLVAGAPLSFIYDLHSSQYVDRVDLSPRGRQIAAAPPVEQGGTGELAHEEAEAAPVELADEGYGYSFDEDPLSAGGLASKAKRTSAAPLPVAPPVPAPAASGLAAPRRDHFQQLERQEQPRVDVQQMSSLFRYDIADPVTIPDRSSTLVAIVNQRVNAEEVVFFRPEESHELPSSHPYRAVKFTNDTPFTLEKGPVTLYSGGTFVGEGFLDRVEPASTHFVSFAIDGKVSLDSDYSTEEEGAKLLRISDGQIVSEVLQIERTTYTIKNLHDEAVTAYVKTSRRPNYELRNLPKETVETPDALIVPVKVAARKIGKLPIEWASRTVRHLGIDTSLATNVLQLQLQGGKLPEPTATAVRRVLDLKAELEKNRAESRRLQRQHEALSRDQDRVRANLDTLRKTKGNLQLQNQLAQKLAQQENELSTLSGNLVQLSEKEAELENEMNAVIRTVSLSNPTN